MTDSSMESGTPLARRAIVTGLGAGAAALGVAAAAQAQPAGGMGWKPAMEAQDSWMDLPGRHRFVIDSTSPEGGGHALFYTRNYYTANKAGYGLEPSQLAVIIILRAESTPFGYSDAVWAKYGATLAKMLKLSAAEAKIAATRNPYADPDAKGTANRGVTLSTLIADGARFAVCGMATMGISHRIASETHGNADDIHKEIVANLIPNAHLVTAGIVAVNRAQERGYAFAYTG